jgi:hypothetical protein
VSLRDILWAGPENDGVVVIGQRIVAAFHHLLSNLWNRAARIAALIVLPAIAHGQMVSPTMSDATVVARGGVRFGALTEWTRFNALFGPDGKTTIPLGASLSGNLDASAFPLLESLQPAAQTLARAPALQLGIGTLRTTADSRIATVPFSVEYGLTRRITVGINVPVVQTRTVITTQLNGRTDSTANLGVNPAGFFFQSAAFTANAQVTSGIEGARNALIIQMAHCGIAPTDPGCPALNARAAEASALTADAGSFAQAARALYGVSASDPGAPFAPRAGSAMQQAIDNHLSDLRSGFSSFGLSAGSGSFATAKGFAANAQLQELLSDPRYGIGIDSVGTTTQLAIGDVELSVASQLFNSFPDSVMGGLHWRGTVAGIVRVGTGHPARGSRPLDIGTGDGQTDVEARAAVDLMIGKRVLTTVAATYTQQLGSVAYERLPNSPGSSFVLGEPVAGSIVLGNMAAVRFNPRFLITRGWMVGGLFNAYYRGADQVTVTGVPSAGATYGNPNATTTWADGLTISYSNLATRAGTGDARFPAEVCFSHIETVGSTAAGPVKSNRDALELRIYFRARR